MPGACIVRESAIERTPRVKQLEGLFDIPPAERTSVRWEVHLPLDERPWQIGLIVGPSGAGKTTVLRELFGPKVVNSFEWPENGSIVDAFARDMSIKEIVLLLSAVGFASPPSWLRPFHVLSTGEQFRATMARALAEGGELFALDEFTSVIDRVVAKIGSVAAAKAIRRGKQRCVLATCHYDVAEWLQPDWVFQPHLNEFQWRRLQRRPAIDLTIRLVDRAAWRLFRAHHYLSGELHRSARCFLAEWNGTPVAICAVLFWPHATASGWREHRVVCLPDFQGVGIGNALSEFVASVYASTHKPYRSVTGNPAMIAHRVRSPFWRMIRAPSRMPQQGRSSSYEDRRGTIADNRYTASFNWVGPARREEAMAFGLISATQSPCCPRNGKGSMARISRSSQAHASA